LITPLHIGDLLPLGQSRGQTEWAAKILITYGYIPGAVLPDSRYWLPQKYDGLRVVDRAWLESKPQPRHTKETNKRKCISCHQWHDLTSEYWHRNPDGLQGWHSKCRACRNEERRQYYLQSVKAA
jgi:hypothetical protein